MAFSLSAVLLLAGSLPSLPSEEVLETIRAGLNQARVEFQAPPLAPSPVLDRAAGRRAEEIAALPHAGRLNRALGVEEYLRRLGVGGYGEVRERVILLGGVPDPSPEVLKLWRDYELAWKTAMDPAWSEVGLGWAKGEDGWSIFVAFLARAARIPSPPDIPALEARVLSGINAERAVRGLAPLALLPALQEIARAHSQDMARGAPFDHHSPATGGPENRVTRGGVAFARLAENIAMNRNADDPAATAVEGWLRSPRHRANILDPRFRQTGIGIAWGAEGDLFFTQLFLTPVEP